MLKQLPPSKITGDFIFFSIVFNIFQISTRSIYPPPLHNQKRFFKKCFYRLADRLQGNATKCWNK